MSKVPQTVANEATDGINALIDASDKLREWQSPEIQKLFALIKSLQRIDARAAFAHFGLLAAICGDVDGVRGYYRKALLLPYESSTKYDFWVSMGNAGMYGEAQEVGVWLLDPKRGFFPKVWKHAVSMGLVLSVMARLHDAKRMYPELDSIDFSYVEKLAAVMRERGLQDSYIGSVLDLMGGIQRRHRTMFNGSLVSTLKTLRSPEDPPYIYLSITIDASVGEIRAMNRRLARLIAEEFPGGAFPSGLVASFAKALSADLRAAA